MSNPTCVICLKVCETQWGNNADPLAKGKCCDVCNYKVMIRRLQMYQEAKVDHLTEGALDALQPVPEENLFAKHDKDKKNENDEK